MKSHHTVDKAVDQDCVPQMRRYEDFSTWNPDRALEAIRTDREASWEELAERYLQNRHICLKGTKLD